MSNISKQRSTPIALIRENGLSLEQQAEIQRLKDARFATNTKRAYSNALKQFIKSGGSFPATSSQLEGYILHLEDKGLSIRTIKSYIYGIKQAHAEFNFINPVNEEVKKTLQGLSKDHRGKAKRKGDPMSPEDLTSLIKSPYLKTDEVSRRDHFMLTTMFWTGCRTDEMANLRIEDIKANSTELEYYIRHSKTDQLGTGNKRTVPCLCASPKSEFLCPLHSYHRYMEALPYKEPESAAFKRSSRNGKLLDKPISARSYRNIIRGLLEKNGVPPEHTSNITGHSFRHTLATIASVLNINTLNIQALGGWNSADTVKIYAGDDTTSAIKLIGQELSN